MSIITKNIDALHLRAKYDHIHYVEGEDLNIARNIERILKYCWYKVEKYRSVERISQVTGMPQTRIIRFATKMGWESRVIIKRERKHKIKQNGLYMPNMLQQTG